MASVVSVVRKMKRRRMRNKPVCLSILVPLIYRQGEKLKTHEKGEMENVVMAVRRWRWRRTGNGGRPPQQKEDRGTGLATFRKVPFKLKGTNLKQKMSGETDHRKKWRRSRGVRRSTMTLRNVHCNGSLSSSESSTFTHTIGMDKIDFKLIYVLAELTSDLFLPI